MTITNTEKQAKENPAGVLLEHLAHGGSSNSIEASEARGQRELVASTMLPSNQLMTGAPGDLAPFEALGIVFGKMADGDPLFREAKLPTGWTKRGTDHDMWSVVVDQHGRERINVFYKAAFYDRRAHMGLQSRLSTHKLNDGRWVVRDNALGTIAHDGGKSGEGYPDPSYGSCSEFVDANDAMNDAPWPDPVKG